MKWSIFNRRVISPAADVRSIRFLGEKDGAPTRELKRRLCECFRQNPNVKAAYLTRVSYGATPDVIAICVRTEIGADQCVVREAGKVLDTCGTDDRVEVVFIDSRQELQLRETRCQPFFGG